MALNFEKIIGELPYRLHRPQLAVGAKAPLIVFLHGVGERGTDNDAQISYAFFQEKISLFSAKPVFILAPQAPESDKWITIDGWTRPTYKLASQPTVSMRKLIELVDGLRKMPGVDARRIYVTGLSMGGYGVYDLVARRPDWFAGAVVVCGRGDPGAAERIKDVPFFLVHGEKDALVPPAYSHEMIEALKKIGAQPEYREYAGVGHDAWTRAYVDQTVIDWLFGKKR